MRWAVGRRRHEAGRITVAARAATVATVLGLVLLAAGKAPAGAALASSVPRPVPITAFTPSNCPSEGSSPPHPTSTTAVIQAPWAQKALDFQAAWQAGHEGAGVTVAVLDSGVDVDSGIPGRPQLAGRVREIDLTRTGLSDCDGHGTAVAGILAASDQTGQGNSFAGVAPEAEILSVKVTVREGFSSANGNADLAHGIIDATLLGARVISISVQGASTSELAQAVAFAQSRDVVIVAAAGNDHQPGQPAHGPFYPASYPGVLSVGALNPDGSLNELSDERSNAQVTAPGVDVTSLTPGGYNDQLTGTSFATPFVAGVAALVIASHPGLSAQGVVARIVDTADGPAGPGTGAGMVNPLQAVTSLLPSGGGQTPGSSHAQKVPVARAVPADPGTRDAAMAVTAGSLGGTVLVILGSLVIAQGRRRRWRPGL